MYKSAEGHSSKQKFTFGLVAIVYFLTACGGPVSATPKPTEGPIPLPSGSILIPIPPVESQPLIDKAKDFFVGTGCVIPPVELYRTPKVDIAPGVIQDAFVEPGDTPEDPMKIGLATHAGLPNDQDVLNLIHEFLHICETDQPMSVDRSIPLFSYTDIDWGINTTVIPTIRFKNPGLTTDVMASTTAGGEKELMPIAGSLEELFAHSIIDYLIEVNGKMDLLTKQRSNDPIQPGINFVRNALSTKSQMQDAIKIMQNNDPKEAFDLLYGVMLRRGLNDGIITMQDGGAREQQMKFYFFLMLMRISDVSTPYALDKDIYELDVKNDMSQMFYGNGRKLDSLSPEQRVKINDIFKDMFLKTPVLSASSRKQKFVHMEGFGPNGTIVITKQLRPGAPRWDIRSQISQLLPSKHSGS